MANDLEICDFIALAATAEEEFPLKHSVVFPVYINDSLAKTWSCEYLRNQLTDLNIPYRKMIWSIDGVRIVFKNDDDAILAKMAIQCS